MAPRSQIARRALPERSLSRRRIVVAVSQRIRKIVQRKIVNPLCRQNLSTVIMRRVHARPPSSLKKTWKVVVATKQTKAALPWKRSLRKFKMWFSPKLPRLWAVPKAETSSLYSIRHSHFPRKWSRSRVPTILRAKNWRIMRDSSYSARRRRLYFNVSHSRNLLILQRLVESRTRLIDVPVKNLSQSIISRELPQRETAH